MSTYEFPWIAGNPATIEEEDKTHRFGKICDWTGSSLQEQEAKTERRKTRIAALAAELSQAEEEEEDDFATVDRLKKPSTKTKKPVYKKDVEDAKKGGLKRRVYPERSQKPREASIAVDQNWSLIQEIELSKLMKLSAVASEPVDLSVNGSVCYYNRSIDKIVTRLHETLAFTTKPLLVGTTSSDPIIKSLAESTEEMTVYATDAILTTLMCVTRSVYGWDIVVTKDGNKIFLDKRKGGPLDNFTVNENAPEPPSDETGLNTPASLALEATLINHAFKKHVIKQSETVSVAEQGPFQDDQTLYRYRKYTLQDSVSVVVRTQIDAAVQHTNGTLASIPFTDSTLPLRNTLLANIHAINEYDSKAVAGSSDYRQKLDAQRGAVFATEIKNNGNKLAKWTVQSILSGADLMKYVTRVSPKDKTKHLILGASTHKPADLAMQMNLRMESAWGVVRTYADLFAKHENGKFIMIRDANKPVLRVYSVPQANV